MFVLGYSGFTRDSRMGVGQRSTFAKTDQGFDSIFEFRDGEVPFSMFPLGYFGHDASATLLKDGCVVACAAEERFTRVKYSLNLAGNTLLPRNAIRYCLNAAGIGIQDVDLVAHYCGFTPALVQRRLDLLRPFLTADQADTVRRSFSQVYDGMMDRQVVVRQFAEMTGMAPRVFVPVRHHLAHAASAFFPSGFDEALILTIDGTGEVESAMTGIGRNGQIEHLGSTLLPTSLGALYLIVTVFLGFRSLGDEYKIMGLASYGDPSRYRNVFRSLVVTDHSGKYYTPGLAEPGLKELFLREFGPPRLHNDPVEARHADIAAALQEALNNAVLGVLSSAREGTGQRNLCMAGGVALNCTMNGVIARSGLFDRIFVQPAAGDEGCSVGAAYAAAMAAGVIPSENVMSWNHAHWGPAFTDEDVVRALNDHADLVRWRRCPKIASVVAEELSRGRVAGWFQGRMEFGPRALGHRSILADPRDARMKDLLNEKVKRRESFRPFAPAVLEERASDYFDMTGLGTSPFMLFTVPVREDARALIPAVTHVDGTARVQTVSRDTNPLFWSLISEFGRITGVPVVLNTSYNVRNEPIVCTPADALRCFLGTEIDCVALGEYFVEKLP
jgi:carbamoyltransferase